MNKQVSDPAYDLNENQSSKSYGVWDFIKGILPLLHPYWKQCLVLLLTIVLQLSYSLASPFGIKFIFDQAVGQADTGVLILVFSLLGVGFVFYSLAGLGQDYLAARLGVRVVNDLRLKMLEHLHRLSPSFFNRAKSGDLMVRFSGDLTVVENAVTRGLPLGISNLLEMSGSIFLLFFIEWHLALLIMLAAPLIFMGSGRFGAQASQSSFTRKEVEGSALSLVQESINGHNVVRAFGLEKILHAQFQERLEDLARIGASANFFGALVGRLTNLGIQLLFLLIMGVGAFLTLQGFLTIGGLFAFCSLLANVARGSGDLVEIMPNLIQAIGGLQRIEELFDEQPQVVDMADASDLPVLSESIQFNDVSFSYQRAASADEGLATDQRNLDQVSFSIPKGQAVAFVGTSGSGKSTALNLLTRFYDPQDGSVTVDDVDIRQVTQDSLRAQMGLVFQDTFLFNTSIRENIRYGQLDATQEEIEAATRAAEIHEVIEDFVDGYDTVVGEGGGNLSGGQRQRIGLARALLRQPAILVLDEATSALDPETEAALNRELRELAKNGCTILAVTHRLASAMDMVCILVMEQGKLVEQGSHDELVALGGKYSALWHGQDRWQTMLHANLGETY